MTYYDFLWRFQVDSFEKQFYKLILRNLGEWHDVTWCHLPTSIVYRKGVLQKMPFLTGNHPGFHSLFVRSLLAHNCLAGESECFMRYSNKVSEIAFHLPRYVETQQAWMMTDFVHNIILHPPFKCTISSFDLFGGAFAIVFSLSVPP